MVLEIFQSALFSCWFPGGLDSEVSAYNAGNLGSIPGSGRSPGAGNGKPLQYSCLENPWTEEPGGLSMGSPSVRHVMLYQNEALMRSCSLFSTTSIVDLNEKYV